MVVCHCKGLSERELRSAIRSGAATPRDLARTCGAGSVCGGCRPVLDELLDAHASAESAPRFGCELAAAG
jgi:bacterioferritin-associated ferredoxin